MCQGSKACKACSKKAAVSGISRRRRSKSKHSRINSISMKKLNFKTFQPALEMAGGLVGSKIINSLPPLKDNPTLSAGAKIAIGLFLGGKGNTVGNIANGVMIGGITDLIEKYLPGLTPSPTTMAGLAGLISNRERPQIAGGHTQIGCPVEQIQFRNA